MSDEDRPADEKEIEAAKGKRLNPEEYERRMGIIVEAVRKSLRGERDEKQQLIEDYGGKGGYGIEAAVIFGSYGRGVPREKSDLDILYICDQPGCEGWAEELQKKVFSELGKKEVDLLPETNINAIDFSDPEGRKDLKKILTAETYYAHLGGSGGYIVVSDDPKREDGVKVKIGDLLASS